MIFHCTFIQCIRWRHIAFWLETFFKFLPYVCNIRRLWLLLRPSKFPKAFTEMSLNWKSHCTCLFRATSLSPSVFVQDFECSAPSRLPSAALPFPAPSFVLNRETKERSWAEAQTKEMYSCNQGDVKLVQKLQNKRKNSHCGVSHNSQAYSVLKIMLFYLQ